MGASWPFFRFCHFYFYNGLCVGLNHICLHSSTNPSLPWQSFLFSSQPNVIMSLLLFNAGKCTASLLLSRARVHSKFTLNVSACRLHFYKWHKCQFSASCGATQEVLFIVCARARAPLVRWNGGRERERERCGKMRMFHSEFSLVKVYVCRLC